MNRMTLSLAVLSAVLSLCLAGLPARAATFVFEDRTKIEGVELSVIRIPGGEVEKLQRSENLPALEGLPGWTVEVKGDWIAEPSFLIDIPAQASPQRPQMQLGVAFRIRAIYDPQQVYVPIELVPGFDKAALKAAFSISGDPYRKAILLGQHAAFWKDRPGNDTLVTEIKKSIADNWFYTILDAQKANNLEDLTGLRFDRTIRAFARSTYGSASAFETHFREWDTIFWKIPKGDFVSLIAVHHCGLAAGALAYVVAKNAADPTAAADQKVPDPTEQVAAMSRQLAKCRTR